MQHAIFLCCILFFLPWNVSWYSTKLQYLQKRLPKLRIYVDLEVLKILNAAIYINIF